MSVFPFDQYWWLYAFFLVLVSCILALDLGVFNRTPHKPTFKEASLWTIVWITLAGIVNIALYQFVLYRYSANPELLPVNVTAQGVASQMGLEFLTGYVIEKSLAIDNIFVFALVFSYFNVKAEYQHKVLFWGIIGAVFFRALFIALGSYLMQFHFMIVIFGVFLILTGLKMAFQHDTGDLNDKWIIKSLKRWLPLGPDDGKGSFFLRENGKLFVTPLFLALIVIELSDIVFAVDSVPAIFALTKEPFIVFSSNIMAILGLRSMYFMLIVFMEKFAYIKYGLSAVLVFVGLKMTYLNTLFDGKFPVTWSLMIILFLIGSSMVFSLYKSRNTSVEVGRV